MPHALKGFKVHRRYKVVNHFDLPNSAVLLRCLASVGSFCPWPQILLTLSHSTPACARFRQATFSHIGSLGDGSSGVNLPI